MKRWIKVVLRLLLFVFILLNIITAFQAYKFTHFYNAGDVTIKLDTNGWDKAGDILFGMNVAKNTNTIAPDSTFETVYLLTKNNIKLQGWYLKTDSIAKGTQDPHFIEAKPSFMVKVSRADLLIAVGLELEAHVPNPEANRCGIRELPRDRNAQAQIV